MGVRTGFRFRRFTFRTLLGTTRFKKTAATSVGLRALKRPFRVFGNVRRTARRRLGLERFLPVQVIRAGRIPLLGGFSFLPRFSRGRRGRPPGGGFGRRAASRAGSQSLVSSRPGITIGLQDVQRFRTALRQEFSDLGKRVESQRFVVKMDKSFARKLGKALGNKGFINFAKTSTSRQHPPGTVLPNTPGGRRPGGRKPPGRSPTGGGKPSPTGGRKPPGLSPTGGKKPSPTGGKKPSPKKPPRPQRLRQARTPRTGEFQRKARRLSPEQAKRQRILKALETKRRKGIIKNVFFPGKPPKGKKR